MVTYKCQVCGFVSSVAGEHCGQQMVEQMETPAPSAPAQETAAAAPSAPMPTPAKATEENPPAEQQ
ncbi:MAG: hypothetical protein IPJ89_04860 [Candidatus Iainarchaeum archaeon]|uniref:Uncharacterized protein n=1 Tax=Candidatus Iainarchaeum sp. TaxID=3101447 RepID=A0A7T9I284_9ARCH|nr:MAG: hypothetical protein IPJ89_04860 [Candidatus Diapherotrites archaeon]